MVAFEEKYSFLYGLLVNGVPIYTSFRDGVLQRLRDGEVALSSAEDEPKSKISIRRILHSWYKKRKYKKAKTLIFTSTVYRRDKGRNLAAEYLLDNPDQYQQMSKQAFESIQKYRWSELIKEYEAYFEQALEKYGKKE